MPTKNTNSDVAAPQLEVEAWTNKHQNRLEENPSYYRCRHARIVPCGMDFMLQVTMLDEGGWCDVLRMNFDTLHELLKDSVVTVAKLFAVSVEEVIPQKH